MSWRSEISKSVRELRFVFCQTSPASKGVRQFVQNNYLDIKEKNPNFPFIVRECLNAQPTVMARYDFGVEKRIYVPNLEEGDVDSVVKELIEQSKEVNAAIPNKF
jgi:NADH dehydrogenase (ubiquinone) 1 alpha subcomplex subunit 2